MPSTFLAHQVPALAAKRHWPALDGVALVVGSGLPDMAQAFDRRWDGHSFVDQFLWSLPVGLVLTALLRRWIAPRLAPYLPDCGHFRLRDYGLVDRHRHALWVSAVSVLIGSFSHLVLDQFTHPDSWLARQVDLLQRNAFSVGPHGVEWAMVLQIVLSFLLTLVAVWQLWRIGRERAVLTWVGVPVGPRPTPARSVGAVRACGVAAAVLMLIVAGVRWPLGVIVSTESAFWAGWVLAAALAAVAGPPGPPRAVDDRRSQSAD
ncbi:MAG: DUF4184 family protein [Actinomycetes bacterium]